MLSDLLAIMDDQSSVLAPSPTALAAKTPTLKGIRAVVFDIYGTLFVSGAGDMSLAQQEDREAAMLDVFAREGLAVPEDCALNATFHDLIKTAHEDSRAKGIDFPEAEIREIWQKLLSGLGHEYDGALIERLSVRFETSVNPVWPMPRLAWTLRRIHQREDFTLGIVSNAQFYTPLLFQHFLGKSTHDLGFDEELCIWSYQERIAKPSASLFAKLKSALADRGIAPAESVYIGNDMRNDIVPAAAAGLRTALFAGDQRSLRLRGHAPEKLPCDLILTRLDQLPRCLA
ncbi:MAG: HAD family hydrolase [Gammaproteobacteria bacterium]|nr:HAD family hydrolase [Gammaproteobacteria bacterium]